MKQVKQQAKQNSGQYIKQYAGKRQCLVLLPFALLYALFLVLGDWDSAAGVSSIQNLGRILFWMAVSYAVLFVFCSLLTMFQITLQKQKEKKIEAVKAAVKEVTAEQNAAVKIRRGKWYVYLIFFLVCFLCWLPYFLIYFPGWISNDSVWQLEQVCGWVPGSNHHPYAHTMIIKFFFMLGFRIFGTYTGATAFFTFFQMIIMAAVYAFILYWLYQNGIPMFWLVISLLFYAVLPINGLYAICMSKDVLFSGALLLYAWTTGQIAMKNGKNVLYFIFGLAVCLLRSNGIFVFLGTSFFLLIWGLIHKNWKKVLLSVVAVIACYLLYQGPVLNALQVEKPDTIEGLTMPTQHLLSAYLNGGELREEESELLSAVIPMDTVASYYNPYFFDIVKNYIRDAGNQEVIAEHKGEYFMLWLQVGLRNPKQYLEAEVKQTMGYWAKSIPDYQYLYEQYLMAENPFEMTTQRKLFSYDFGLKVDAFLLRFQDFYNKVWSLGLNTWLLFFAFAFAAYRGKNTMLYVPYVMLLISLLLATPVYSEFRYAYGLFVALPFLLCASLGLDDIRGVVCSKAETGKETEETVNAEAFGKKNGEECGRTDEKVD